jgi:hypothetical protein
MIPRIKNLNKRQAAGWIAVGLSTLVACYWAFWGIIENFHEGWYFESWLSNLGLMFLQYLSPMILTIGVALISIYWPRIGGSLHVILAIFAVWFFQAFSNPVMFLLITPIAALGVLYWFGRPQPRRMAAFLAAGLPFLTLIISGAEPVIRVSQRFDDGGLQARLVHGNNVDLIWAPDGPGWPRSGVNWHAAQRVCQNLDEDGLTLTSSPVYIWRLPAQASYQTTPDKESPLWNVHSQVIYWWTATEVNEEQAYMIAYDGKVWPRTKKFAAAYLGFRCVKLRN